MKNPIMTHLVCGYPSIKESQKLLSILSKYSKFVEIQIPFSDPIADGPIITYANEKALENGVTPTICFDFLEKFMKENNLIDSANICSEGQGVLSLRGTKQSSKYGINNKSSFSGSPHFVRDDNIEQNPPANLLIMTYYNIVYNYGVEKFIKKAKQVGIYGFIIPDMPYDEKEGQELIKLCKKYDINLIQVVSPTCKPDRLKKLFSISSGFVYAVSQNMTTGNKIDTGTEFENYIKNLKKLKNIEIGVGFGVKTHEDINNVCKVADFAIIGSELIRIVNEKGVKGVEKFFVS